MGFFQVALVLLNMGSSGPATRTMVFAPGTTLSIRFLEAISGGKDSVGTPVLVQTLGALRQDACAATAPYMRAAGRVTLSRGGRMFARKGALGLRFDSLEVQAGRWVKIDAVLDTLEYSGASFTSTGVVRGTHRSFTSRVLAVGIAGISDLEAVPLLVISSFLFAQPGRTPHVVAGERGGLRLVAPLHVAVDLPCISSDAEPPLATIPDIPAFVPRTRTKSGMVLSDPINLLFVGSQADLDSAFRRVGWTNPVHGTVATVTREIVAGIVNRQAIGAPLSTQYFRGRPQDLAFEQAGPNALFRHHIRFWLLDSTTQVWVGAATEDVGIKINPFIGRFTHKIRPVIDGERDLIVKEMEATGCADLARYVELPGSIREGRNATGQRFTTDGRAAIMVSHPCSRAALVVSRPAPVSSLER